MLKANMKLTKSTTFIVQTAPPNVIACCDVTQQNKINSISFEPALNISCG
jgi:hypothetical protein